jgi:uncharacterized protein (DUF488 family)
MPNFYTSGYEGETVESFFSKLKNNKVDLVVDVRQNPFSFKRGFNRSQLEILSRQNDIDYVHIKELGTPIPLRKRLKEKNDYQKFFSDYEMFISGYHDIIEDLIELSNTRNICIICFERDHNFCHRKIIANITQELSGNILEVCHL